MSAPRTIIVIALATAACHDGWKSQFTATDASFHKHQERIAPMIYLDAKPPRPVRAVGYFALTSPETKDDVTMQSFKAHAAEVGRDLGCEVVVFADVFESSILAPDNDLLACGNCGGSSAPTSRITPPMTKKFYCCVFDTSGTTEGSGAASGSE